MDLVFWDSWWAWAGGSKEIEVDTCQASSSQKGIRALEKTGQVPSQLEDLPLQVPPLVNQRLNHISLNARVGSQLFRYPGKLVLSVYLTESRDSWIVAPDAGVCVCVCVCDGVCVPGTIKYVCSLVSQRYWSKSKH